MNASHNSISVTVDGPSVSREVTWEQVRAYLRAKGWGHHSSYQSGVETWVDAANEYSVYLGPTGARAAESLQLVVYTLHHHEKRHPSAVLADIARGTEEPAALDLDAIENAIDADVSLLPSTPGPTFLLGAARGLVAELRAARVELARLRAGANVAALTVEQAKRARGETEALRQQHDIDVDVLFIDDPIKNRVEAESPARRKQVIEWWNDVAFTRLEPNASAIVFATRWHPEETGSERVLRRRRTQKLASELHIGGELVYRAMGRGETEREIRGRAIEARRIAVTIPMTMQDVYRHLDNGRSEEQIVMAMSMGVDPSELDGR